MDEKTVAPSTDRNTARLQHLPDRENLVLNYTANRTHITPGRGTIILLPPWYSTVEADQAVISPLNRRGFNVVTYNWHAPWETNARHDVMHAYTSRNCHSRKRLNLFFHDIILPDFPAPFYVLARSMGGLFALTAHDILRNVTRRMIIISPILELEGHRANSLYHHYMRLRCRMNFNGRLKKNLDAATDVSVKEADSSAAPSPHKKYRPSPQLYKMVLNAAAHVLSPSYCQLMALPTLFIISSHDSVSNPRLTRELASRLHMAESITIHGSAHDILNDKDYYRKQFWAAFDTFIPGSGMTLHRYLMEDNTIV